MKEPECAAWVLRKDERGAVFVEFLIAFLPVHVFFLCLIQTAIIYSVRLVVEHAAITGARAAAVVIGDEPRVYNGERTNELRENSERRRVVRNAVLFTLAPLILDGLIQDVDVLFPRADQVDGAAQTGTIRFAPMTANTISKVRVRVEVDAACRIGFASQIVCGRSFFLGSGTAGIATPTRRVRAEAIYPYQGASYAY